MIIAHHFAVGVMGAIFCSVTPFASSMGAVRL